MHRPPWNEQESKELLSKQRQMQAAMATLQKEARAAEGQRERAAALEAELAEVRQAAQAAAEQQALAASRSAVLEKAYEQAQQVGWGRLAPLRAGAAAVGRLACKPADPCPHDPSGLGSAL